jgi:hypothetical protein
MLCGSRHYFTSKFIKYRPIFNFSIACGECYLVHGWVTLWKVIGGTFTVFAKGFNEVLTVVRKWFANSSALRWLICIGASNLFAREILSAHTVSKLCI